MSVYRFLLLMLLGIEFLLLRTLTDNIHLKNNILLHINSKFRFGIFFELDLATL